MAPAVEKPGAQSCVGGVGGAASDEWVCSDCQMRLQAGEVLHKRRQTGSGSDSDSGTDEADIVAAVATVSLRGLLQSEAGIAPLGISVRLMTAAWLLAVLLS